MNILKTASKVLTIGNHFIQYGRTLGFSSAQTPITQPQGVFDFSLINEPLGIAIDATNNRIFVCNIGNHTVSILNYTNPAAGSPVIISTLQGAFNRPSGIAIDAINNRIFVSNFGNHTVSILNYTNPAAGSPTVISTLQGSFNQPAGIAIDPPSASFPDGRIFVSNQSTATVSILNYTNPVTGSPVVITTTQGGFDRPEGITIDASANRIFVVNWRSSVSVLNYSNPTGVAATSATSGITTGVMALALDVANNRIFVTNAGNTINPLTIWNYTNPTSGTFSTISTAQGSFSTPNGIAIDAINNRIFVANYGNNTVSIITNIFS